MQKKITINNSNQTWNPKKRYKINEVVSHNGIEYQNATGINTEPGIGSDWLSLDVIPSSTYLAINNVTLSAANWTLVDGLFEFTYSNAAIKENSQVDFTPLNDSIDIVKAADVYPLITTSTGAAKCFAKNLPTGDIIVNVLIY